MYALNLADLSKPVFGLPAAIMVAPVTPSQRLVRTNPNTVDAAAIVLECADQQAQAIIDILRLKSAIRAYQSKTGIRGWHKA